MPVNLDHMAIHVDDVRTDIALLLYLNQTQEIV